MQAHIGVYSYMYDTIKLSESRPFGAGGNRACYLDPRDDSRCIKVILPERTATKKRAQVKGIKSFRPLGYYDDNLRELKSFHLIQKYLDSEVWTHLPRCYGLVDTDLGVGIVTDLIRDYNGTISICLKTKLRAHGYDDNFRNALEEFIAYLRSTALPTRDLLLHNIVASDLDLSGRCRFHLIDSFGSADILPFPYWFKKLAQIKVERKIFKFRGKIASFSAKYSIPNLCS